MSSFDDMRRASSTVTISKDDLAKPVDWAAFFEEKFAGLEPLAEYLVSLEAEVRLEQIASVLRQRLRQRKETP